MYALPVGRVNWHDIVSCVLVLHWSGGVWSEVKTVLLVMQMVVHAPLARSRPPTHPPTHFCPHPHHSLFAQMNNAMVLAFGEEAEAIDSHCIP